MPPLFSTLITELAAAAFACAKNNKQKSILTNFLAIVVLVVLAFCIAHSIYSGTMTVKPVALEEQPVTVAAATFQKYYGPLMNRSPSCETATLRVAYIFEENPQFHLLESETRPDELKVTPFQVKDPEEELNSMLTNLYKKKHFRYFCGFDTEGLYRASLPFFERYPRAKRVSSFVFHLPQYISTFDAFAKKCGGRWHVVHDGDVRWQQRFINRSSIAFGRRAKNIIILPKFATHMARFLSKYAHKFKTIIFLDTECIGVVKANAALLPRSIEIYCIHQKINDKPMYKRYGYSSEALLLYSSLLQLYNSYRPPGEVNQMPISSEEVVLTKIEIC